MSNYNHANVLYPLTYFQALEELFVDGRDFWGQDSVTEENIQTVYGTAGPVWPRTKGLRSEIRTLVWDMISEGIGTVATEIPDWPSEVWNPPKIRIVEDEDEILGEQEVDKMTLICVSREEVEEVAIYFGENVQTDDDEYE
jgi:hypothetical protein